jgi:hypothetical protein
MPGRLFDQVTLHKGGIPFGAIGLKRGGENQCRSEPK